MKACTVYDDQICINMKVYQGERSRSFENYLLGEFRISGIPPAPKGVSEVDHCFEIDANGILTVTNKIVSTGKTEKLTVTTHSGRLSKQEIEKMLKDAEKFKNEDQQYKKKVEAYNGLEDCLYVLKKKMEKNDIPTNVLENMESVIDDTTKWLLNNKAASSDEIEAKKKHLEFISDLFVSN